MNYDRYFEECQLCPRQCRVNRLHGQTGFCGETAHLRVATIEAHFGEEPPISGTNGSGTVFFSGCTLQCVFCQNYQISTQGLGQPLAVADVVQRLVTLYHTQGIHNVNFVTPDHFFPYCWHIVQALRGQAVHIPAVYNLSGYTSLDMLRATEAFADIYLPDFKYADRQLARQLSACENYTNVAMDALAEMIRQKGFLDTTEAEDAAIVRKGVLVRHLILPGQIQNSIDALTTLFLEFGRRLPLSLMSQYHPVQPCSVPEMNRRITFTEFQQVYDHTLSLGFEHLFVQYPERPAGQPEFLPDFKQKQPFKGNTR